MSEVRKEPDPVVLSILWNGLISICEEVGATLLRTAFSQAVREGEDFSAALFDRDGRMIAQGNFTPGHLGAMPFVVKSMLEFFKAEDMHSGDGILVNDSFLGSGHFPDFFLISPAFSGTTLIGYVVNTAHHVDVGGAAPGSQKVKGVTEAFQEGIRILPVRAVKAGRFDEELLRILLGNVRLPDQMRGDLGAQRNANYIGVQRFVKLYEEVGKATFEAAIETIMNRSEARMRDLIRLMPDGTYSFDDYVEDSGQGDGMIRLAVDVTIKEDTIAVDFSRSSDQVPVALNSYLNYTRAYSLFAIKVFADTLLPQNDGMLRPISVTAREGSFFNPKFPAPSGGRAAIQTRIFEIINGALGQALPERAHAGFCHWSNPNFGGVDPRTGRPFVMYDLIFGGYGARSQKDGAEALSSAVNCANIPIEVHETYNPIVVRRLEILPDTGGAGRYRGGCGVRKDIEVRADHVSVTLLGDRHVHPAYGLQGGSPGRLAETILNPDGNHPARLSSKEVVELSFGDVISFRLNGAGGYGDPSERDAGAIKEDIAEGYVTNVGAGRDYSGAATDSK